MENDANFEQVYAHVQPWFDSIDDAWAWYTRTKIPSFGMTAEQLINEHGDKGLAALKHWIDAKNLGAFE